MSKKKKDLEDTPHLNEDPKTKKSKFDVHRKTSDLKGLSGIFETLIRSFRRFSFLASIVPVIIMYTISVGLSLTPGIILIKKVYVNCLESNLFVQAFSLGSSIAISYFLYGLTLIFIVPLINKTLRLDKLKPWRGSWFSLRTLPWYYHNALTQLVRYSFLDFITPSPLNILFYRMMGMKIGKGVMINTTNISDPCLITIEDYATIGGSATIFGHYAQGGFLVLAPVIIKKGATVGLKASIMGDVVVGEKVTVKPHSILLPKTRLKKGDPQG